MKAKNNTPGPQRHDFSVISRHGEQALNNSGSEDKNSDYGFDNGEESMFNICTAVSYWGSLFK